MPWNLQSDPSATAFAAFRSGLTLISQSQIPSLPRPASTLLAPISTTIQYRRYRGYAPHRAYPMFDSLRSTLAHSTFNSFSPISARILARVKSLLYKHFNVSKRNLAAQIARRRDLILTARFPKTSVSGTPILMASGPGTARRRNTTRQPRPGILARRHQEP